VREPKTRGGTPLLPAGENAGATILPPANEFLARVSRCAAGHSGTDGAWKRQGRLL